MSGPAVWSFHYASGAVAYDVRDETAISVTPDSAARGEAAQTITAAVRVSYQLRDSGATTPFSGTVDSFIVSGIVGTPAQRLVTSPIAFRGYVDPTGRRVSLLDGGEVRDCASLTLSVLAEARQILPPVGGTLTRGASWQDTTVATTCRGGIPVTTTAIRSYTVVGADSVEAGVVRVRRASVVSAAGQATVRGTAVSITGSGSGEATLRFDTGRGRYLGGTGESTTTLTVTAGGQPRTFVQRVRSVTTLRRDGTAP